MKIHIDNHSRLDIAVRLHRLNQKEMAVKLGVTPAAAVINELVKNYTQESTKKLKKSAFLFYTA